MSAWRFWPMAILLAIGAIIFPIALFHAASDTFASGFVCAILIGILDRLIMKKLTRGFAPEEGRIL